MVTLLHNMTCVGSISQNCQLNEKHCLTEIMTYSTVVRRVMKWKGNAMYGINVRLVIQVTVNTRHKLKFPILYNICFIVWLYRTVDEICNSCRIWHNFETLNWCLHFQKGSGVNSGVNSEIKKTHTHKQKIYWFIVQPSNVSKTEFDVDMFILVLFSSDIISENENSNIDYFSDRRLWVFKN